jgi:hypothetical protein
MEPSYLDRIKEVASQGSTWFYVFIFLGSAILAWAISTSVYHTVTPSGTQAKLTANSTFAAYEKVTKLAPLGCPTTPVNMRLCDYYAAASSY